MDFLKKLFGKKEKPVNPDNGPMPTRGLNLKFTPTPGNGPAFARQFVQAVNDNEGIQLDYSIATLDFVEEFLTRFRNEGLSVNEFAETIFVAGAYVGQVMVNNNNGVWINQDGLDLPQGVTTMPIVIKLPNGKIADPIAKAFKRFHNGDIDSIKYFYTAMVL